MRYMPALHILLRTPVTTNVVHLVLKTRQINWFNISNTKAASSIQSETLKTYFPKIHVNVTVPPSPLSSKWLLYTSFLTYILLHSQPTAAKPKVRSLCRAPAPLPFLRYSAPATSAERFCYCGTLMSSTTLLLWTNLRPRSGELCHKQLPLPSRTVLAGAVFHT
jgi:hypothetical protein